MPPLLELDLDMTTGAKEGKPLEPNAGRADATTLTLGYGAAAIAVTIWAAWIVFTRYSVDAAEKGVALTPIDIGLLRFAAPALLLAPVWLKVGLKPRHMSWPHLFALLGWGAPFALFAAAGLQTVDSGMMGALTPGTMPIFVALIGWLMFRETFGRVRQFGFLLIGLAVLAVVIPAVARGDEAVLRGAPYLLGAAFCWAVFTVAFRRSGLGPVEAAGIVAAWSTLFLGAAYLFVGGALPELSTQSLAGQIFSQGVLSGAISVVTFAVAIDKLGPARAASLSALVPVLAALMGVVFLGETLTAATTVAIVAASFGVAFVNGAFDGFFAKR